MEELRKIKSQAGHVLLWIKRGLIIDGTMFQLDEALKLIIASDAEEIK